MTNAVTAVTKIFQARRREDLQKIPRVRSKIDYFSSPRGGALNPPYTD